MKQQSHAIVIDPTMAQPLISAHVYPCASLGIIIAQLRKIGATMLLFSPYCLQTTVIQCTYLAIKHNKLS